MTDYFAVPAVARPGRLHAPPPECRADLLDRAARVARHAKRIRRKDREPITCWGGCKRTLPRGSRPQLHGWTRRPSAKTGVKTEAEFQCAACTKKYGWQW